MPASNLTMIMHPTSKGRLNYLHRRAVKAIFLDTTLTTDQKLDEEPPQPTSIHQGFVQYTGSLTMRPQDIYVNLYTRPPSRYFNSRKYQLSLPRPKMDIFKTSIHFSGAFLWNSVLLTVGSCYSLSSFKRKLHVHPEAVTYDGF